MGSAEHKISTGPRSHLHLTSKQLVPLLQAQALAAHSRSYRRCFCWREESVCTQCAASVFRLHPQGGWAQCVFYSSSQTQFLAFLGRSG